MIFLLCCYSICIWSQPIQRKKQGLLDLEACSLLLHILCCQGLCLLSPPLLPPPPFPRSPCWWFHDKLFPGLPFSAWGCHLCRAGVLYEADPGTNAGHHCQPGLWHRQVSRNLGTNLSYWASLDWGYQLKTWAFNFMYFCWFVRTIFMAKGNRASFTTQGVKDNGYFPLKSFLLPFIFTASKSISIQALFANWY